MAAPAGPGRLGAAQLHEELLPPPAVEVVHPPEELASALRAVYPPAASRPDSTGRLPSENAARRVGPVHAYLPLTINGEVDL